MTNETEKEDLKRDEMADAIQQAVAWARSHPQEALWGGIGAAVAVLLLVGFLMHRSQVREESWASLSAATAYAYQGQPDASLNQVKSVTDAYPGTSAAGYAKLLGGDVLFQQGKYKEAEQAYQSAADQPGNPAVIPMALSGLALSQEAAGDCPAAAATSQRFLDAHQDHFLAPQTHAVLARCLAAMGKTDEAKAAFQRIEILYPNTYWEGWAKAHRG